MKIIAEAANRSRQRYRVELPVAEVAGYFTQALTRLAQTVKIAGFRPGKAPPELIRQNLPEDRLREEAYSLAAKDAWQKVSRQLTATPLETPQVTVERFNEGEPGRLTFEFDIRPVVKVGRWQSITLPTPTEVKVTDQEVAKALLTLQRNQAQLVIKLDQAQRGDQVVISFEGYLDGVKKDKLSANRFPVLLGDSPTIPGFQEQLIGLKKGDSKEFSVSFPPHHFDKELAGREVKFFLKVEEVYRLILPLLDQAFVNQLGVDNLQELKEKIKQNLRQRQEEEQFASQKAAWLAQFEPLIAVEIPQSLINAEVERSRQTWREFLAAHHLSAEKWLRDRQLSIEQLEKDWLEAAQRSVRIGLGLVEIAKERKRELKSNQDLQQLLDELVRQAVN